MGKARVGIAPSIMEKNNTYSGSSEAEGNFVRKDNNHEGDDFDNDQNRK